jgi:hypothetical protein
MSTPILSVPDVAPLEADDDELVELELLQAARSAAKANAAAARETAEERRMDDSWTGSESGLSTPAVTGRPAPEPPVRLLPATCG